MNFEPTEAGTLYGAGKFEIFSTIQVPPSAGKWIISGNFHIHVAKRPRWLTRKLMWWLLEWKWEDA